MIGMVGWLGFFIVIVVSIVIGAPVSSSSAAGKEGDLRDALDRRYQPARMQMDELVRPAPAHPAPRVGKFLILSAEQVPATLFRVIQADGRRVHVMDFARVDIGVDGQIDAQPGPLTLRQGTRLVVLDVVVKRTEVHLLTHTADPVPTAGGTPAVYGCTEFVFHLDPQVLATGLFEPVFQTIEQWLEWTPEQRLCAPGMAPICFEP